MLKALLVVTVFAGLFVAKVASADQTTVAFDSGAFTLYTNSAKTTPLSAGVAATLGDGAMLQLGYYTQGTSTNPFAGSFVLMAGAGGPNTFPTYGKNISIGDDPSNGAGTGQYALSLNFVTGSATGNNLPAAGQELVVRFFNNTTLANSSKYNAVNASTWTFLAPASPSAKVNISLDDPGIRFQDGTSNSFYTSLDNPSFVPEPSSYVTCLGLGAISLIALRRQRKKMLSR